MASSTNSNAERGAESTATVAEPRPGRSTHAATHTLTAVAAGHAEQTASVVVDRRLRKAWIAVAVSAAIFGALSTVSAPLLALRGRWFEALLSLGFVRASYWIGFGAWLRTPWAKRHEVDPVPGPTPLTEVQLRRYVIAAGLAAVTTTFALGLQAIDGRWMD